MSNRKRYKLGILSTHPIQYYVPWYRSLSNHPEIDLTVYYCHRQTPEGQGRVGYGISFTWDIPMLEGYNYEFLENKASDPNVFDYFGSDTPEIRNIINNGNFNAFIVEGWFNKSFWQAITACWKSKTPIMVRGDSNLLSHGRSYLRRIIKYPIYNWFIPKFDAYLIVGKRAKEYYLNYGAKEEKMFIVPHSVDNNFFSDRYNLLLPDRNKLREDRSIPQDSIVFVLVGALIPRKRPHDFLYAIQRASKVNPRIWGLIVGDGPLKKDLEEISERLKIPIRFTGFLNQKQLPEAYTIADCLVNASSIESWGLTINEAMASHLPALVSDTVGSAPDLVFPDETGLIFQSCNIESLSEQMLNLASDTDNIKRLGQNAFNLIQEYSVKNSTDGTLQAVKSVSNKNCS